MQCPLCHKHNSDIWSRANQKLYYQCQNCNLVYLDQKFYLSEQEEKARYDTHDNNPNDPGYQKFLQPVVDCLVPKLSKPSIGLDFGCGAGSPLTQMFAQHGHKLVGYDPYFNSDPDLLKQQYDFIVSTETFEHVYQPKKEFETLLKCLKPGGYLCIMTQFLDDSMDFETWYYHRDPTHVAFFNEQSFLCLAKAFSIHVSFPVNAIALFST